MEEVEEEGTRRIRRRKGPTTDVLRNISNIASNPQLLSSSFNYTKRKREKGRRMEKKIIHTKNQAIIICNLLNLKKTTIN